MQTSVSPQDDNKDNKLTLLTLCVAGKRTAGITAVLLMEEKSENRTKRKKNEERQRQMERSELSAGVSVQQHRGMVSLFRLLLEPCQLSQCERRFEAWWPSSVSTYSSFCFIIHLLQLFFNVSVAAK